MEELFELQFLHTEDTFHSFESNHLYEIGDADLWVANSDIFVQNGQRKRSVKFRAVRDMDRQILVLDKNQKVVALIVLMNGTIVVNDRYTLCKGTVRYEYNREPTTEVIPDIPFCCLQVNNTEDLFKFKLYYQGFAFEFEANSLGTFLVDPFSRATLEKRAETHASTIDEANGQFRDNKIPSTIETPKSEAAGSSQTKTSAPEVGPSVQLFFTFNVAKSNNYILSHRVQ